MSDLQIFKSEQFGAIRAVEIDGEPWLVGKDVATALGYSNTKDAIASHVDDDDKQIIQRSENATFDIPNRGLTIINESGLYSLVLSSKLPTSKQFRRWVTSEVLPSIRKHGAYMTPDTLDKMISSPEFGIRLLTELKAEREKRIALEGKVEQDKPKVLFANAVETSHNSILVGELAKVIKQNGVEIGQNRLFQWMRDNGYLIKRKGADYNMPSQYSMERGWMEIKESTSVNADGSVRVNKTPKVTGAGQVYFVQRF